MCSKQTYAQIHWGELCMYGEYGMQWIVYSMCRWDTRNKHRNKVFYFYWPREAHFPIDQCGHSPQYDTSDSRNRRDVDTHQYFHATIPFLLQLVLSIASKRIQKFTTFINSSNAVEKWKSHFSDIFALINRFFLNRNLYSNVAIELNKNS